jgi:hypothetical protein
MNSLIEFNKATTLFLIAIVFACVALSPTAQAVSPPPDGGYPNKNTAEGDDALFNLAGGRHNTAVGFEALFSDTIGSDNTAIGANALLSNTIGIRNTATGADALANNTDGNSNTADGVRALLHNTTGFDNTATGFQALFRNIIGSGNTADGSDALFANTAGSGNTANGASALLHNRTGSGNTGIGNGALFSNIGGSNNIALGDLGGADLTGDNNIVIGNQGVAGESNTIRIGTEGTQKKTFIAGISTTGVMGPAVKISSSGQIGVAPSSARFKQEIQSMDKASEALLALRPVTFRYKPEIDPEGVPQFGLVAEDVEKVNPALVARDANGEAYTVRSEAVNAMLLNEFLKEHRKVQELEANAARQQKQIEALTAGLQNVSARLEASKPAPQVVLNNP